MLSNLHMRLTCSSGSLVAENNVILHLFLYRQYSLLIANMIHSIWLILPWIKMLQLHILRGGKF